VLEGQVSFSPELAAQARPTDTLFVIARPADGGRVPVAVFKRPLGALPIPFRLDDSHSMNPAQPLSRAGRVVLVARVSRSGAPAPSAGDLEGSLGPVPVGATALALQDRPATALSGAASWHGSGRIQEAVHEISRTAHRLHDRGPEPAGRAEHAGACPVAR
jgi:hypothetical protein